MQISEYSYDSSKVNLNLVSSLVVLQIEQHLLPLSHHLTDLFCGWIRLERCLHFRGQFIPGAVLIITVCLSVSGGIIRTGSAQYVQTSYVFKNTSGLANQGLYTFTPAWVSSLV